MSENVFVILIACAIALLGAGGGWRIRGRIGAHRRMLAVAYSLDEPECTYVLRSGRPGSVLVVTEGSTEGYFVEARHRPEHEVYLHCTTALPRCPNYSVWIDPSWQRDGGQWAHEHPKMKTKGGAR